MGYMLPHMKAKQKEILIMIFKYLSHNKLFFPYKHGYVLFTLECKTFQQLKKTLGKDLTA